MMDTEIEGQHPALRHSLRDMMDILQGFERDAGLGHALRAAALLVEFGSVQTALAGNPEGAARLVQIAVELERFGSA
ncbi:hypothetical protein [Mangrovicoccus sp. HB161399]|uniref:hypothetical protein n=1 Tax=Mangrovicoccus sp. HB161399 TaxID=2720392 RepID=UPI001552804E|nr:hypothetical protein [Mangrovicoccus sp. HB161399]